jgi:hypothetical protein
VQANQELDRRRGQDASGVGVSSKADVIGHLTIM